MTEAPSTDRPTQPEAQVTRTQNRRPPSVQPTPFALGRYRMLERIGSGGMGEVFAARDQVIGREIAIKRLLDDQPSSEQIERFVREAKIQAMLDHPSIPPVYELAEDPDGRPYLVMKRLIGTTLAEILARRTTGFPDTVRRYPRERLLRAFAEACLAVELAHSRGVIHRDLKPGNIMLGDFGEVFVLDWGVAVVVSSLDAELATLREHRPGTEVVGTKAYMAPEQRDGTVVGNRTDVYALGCMLFEILTGRPLHDSAPIPGELPPELAELCAAATAPDYSARLATARQLGEGVQRYLDGDRDAALRRRLATDHLSRARSAISPRIAMQEAGRALALDPALPGAAEMVGRLMIEDPDAIPEEVDVALARARDGSAAAQAQLARYSYLAYLMIVPFLLVLGVAAPVHLFTLVITTVVLMVTTGFAARDPFPRSSLAPRLLLVIGGNTVLIVVLARLFSPFLVAPLAAALTITNMLGSPAYRRPDTVALLVTAMALAVLAPWCGELYGVLGQSVLFDIGPLVAAKLTVGGRIALSIGLTVYVVCLLSLAAGVALRRARLEEAAQRKLHLQAWRLEQLVPAPRYHA